MANLQDFRDSLLGLYSSDSTFIDELPEVQSYYEFYEGRPYAAEDRLDHAAGQLWAVKEGDYRPTREIRNITKKLLNKQGRFMTSVPPTLVLSTYRDGVDRESIDTKRGVIEKILKDAKFWNKFSKGFLDATIGKRVLLCALTDVDAKGNLTGGIKFRFYIMPEFTYEYDPNDIDTLKRVDIAYQDRNTVGKVAREQRWHKWTYEMREETGTCWATYRIVDGANVTAYTKLSTTNDEGEEVEQEVILEREWNTTLPELPCRVILNDGLTGDLRGHSDVKDLMDLANDYNKTNSDYRDALRFKMFEQPVFIDCDKKSLKGIKVAPNTIIDLKSDPTLGDGTGNSSTAKFGMLSSSFSFQQAADSYLAQLKKDMYELMEQPLPESLLNVPSAKAMKMIYYDLITRCEEKWRTWDEVLEWVVIMIETYAKMGVFKDIEGAEHITLETTTVWEHNYPLPDDDETNKTLAIQEVGANVRSHKSYIEEFGNSEDAQVEFERIIEESQILANATNMLSDFDTVDDQDPNAKDPGQGGNGGKDDNNSSSSTNNKNGSNGGNNGDDDQGQ